MSDDTYNRLRELIYPDEEVLTYSYNTGGLAESVSGKKGEYQYPYLKALTYDKFEQRVYMKQGNDAETAYTYNPLNRRLTNLTAKSVGKPFMDLSYKYDAVGNILALDNTAKVNKPNQFGGETHYSFAYDDLYRLTSSGGSFKQPNSEHVYTLSMSYDTIHNITQKVQVHNRLTNGGTSIEQKKTSYDYGYTYGSSRPHAPTHIGDRTFSYDASGNQTGWESDLNGTRRIISWDEENRIQQIEDNGHTMTYKYNDAGERVFKTGPQGETVYVNQFYTVGNREVGSKHVFVGTSRIVTKLVKKQENVTTPASATDMLDDEDAVDHPGNSDPSGNAYGHDNDSNAGGNSSGNNGGGSGGGSPGKGVILYEPDLFYYHPNHLGSTSFVTDVEGELYQHLEYFPFGETWIEEVSDQHRVPYLFTAKELDRETGLYYFGARYYDPRTSVWQSGDPILGMYLDGKAGMGGVFNSFNLGLYSYGHLNPVKFVDPDGNQVEQADWQSWGERKMELLILGGIFFSLLHPNSIGKIVQAGANFQAIQIAWNFRFGTGNPDKVYNANAPITQAVMNMPKVREAREAFYKKNKGKNKATENIMLRSWYPLFQERPKTAQDGNSAFAFLEFIEATCKVSLTEHVLGSVDINVKPIKDGSALEFTVTNTTDMDSLFGETKPFRVTVPNHSRDEQPELGTMKQTFQWIEKYEPK